MAKMSPNQAPNIFACVGMVGGVLLLSFAGVLVVMTPTPLVEQGAVIAAERAQNFLQASPRRMLGPLTASLLAAPVVPVVPAVTNTTVNATTTNPTHYFSSLNSFEGLLDKWDEQGSSSAGFGKDVRRTVVFVSLKTAFLFEYSTLVELFLMLCFAICYYTCAVVPIVRTYGTLQDMRHDSDGEESDSDGQKLVWSHSTIHHHEGRTDFNNPKFACLSDIWVCCHGLLCPLPRIGHTLEVAGVCGYWQSILCFSCCSVLTCGLGSLCLFPFWRMRVKEAMGIKHFGCLDFLYSILCIPCDVCQQASAVDRKMGYKVSGCCDQIPTGF